MIKIIYFLHLKLNYEILLESKFIICCSTTETQNMLT